MYKMYVRKFQDILLVIAFLHHYGDLPVRASADDTDNTTESMKHSHSQNQLTQSSGTEDYDNVTAAVITDFTEEVDIIAQRYLFPEAKAALYIDRYGYGLNQVLGIAGNILAISLLRRPRMRNSVTSMYMQILACTDISYVTIGLAGRHWARALGSDLASLDKIYCKIWIYLIRVVGSISNWTLACMSAERCIAILMPLKARTILTRRSSLIALGSILAFCVIYFAHLFDTFSIYNGICRIVETGYPPEIRSWVDFFIETASTFSTIATCNCIIISKLIKARVKRQDLMQGKQEDGSNMTSLVAMLVSVSVAFMVLKIPFHIYLIMGGNVIAIYRFPTHAQAKDRLVLAITLWLTYFNHCVNFFLYVISGKEFRNELRAMFSEVGKKCRLKGKKGTGNTVKTKNVDVSTASNTSVTHISAVVP